MEFPAHLILYLHHNFKECFHSWISHKQSKSRIHSTYVEIIDRNNGDCILATKKTLSFMCVMCIPCNIFNWENALTATELVMAILYADISISLNLIRSQNPSLMCHLSNTNVYEQLFCGYSTLISTPATRTWNESGRFHSYIKTCQPHATEISHQGVVFSNFTPFSVMFQ